MAALIGLAIPFASSVAHAELRITEVLINGTSSTDLDEWVEITNMGPNPVDLSDYRLGDEESRQCGSTCEGFFAFPSTVIEVGESFIFTRNIGAFDTTFTVPPQTKRFHPQSASETGPTIAVRDTALSSSPFTFVLNNTQGDEVILLRKEGATYAVVDGVSYLGLGTTSYAPPGGVSTRFMDSPIAAVGSELQSIARSSAGLDTDRASDWVISAAPTPGEVPPSICTNAILELGETCDDGNDVPGDGCGSDCFAECGFACIGAGPFTCTVTCGDGDLGGLEECDDGNAVSGDGCDANCAVETGFDCFESGACDLLETVSECVLDPCALPLRITEVHVDGFLDPASEWFEITNAGPLTIELDLWAFTDQEFEGLGDEGSLAFPPGSSIGPGESRILAANGEVFKDEFGVDASFEYLADSDATSPYLSIPTAWANDTIVQLDNDEDELILICNGFVRDYVRWGPASVERIAAPTTDYGESAPSAGPTTYERVLTTLRSGTSADWATSTCPTPFVAPNPNAPPDVRRALVTTTAGAAVIFQLPVNDTNVDVVIDANGLLGTLEPLSPSGLLRYTPPSSPSSLTTSFDYFASDACSTVGPGHVDIAVAPPACDPAQSNLLITEVHVESRLEPEGEWLEITNPTSSFIDLGYLRIGDSASTAAEAGLVTLLPGTVLGPFEVIVVAASADIFKDDWGFIPQFEWEHDTDGFPNEAPHALFAGRGTDGIIRLDTAGDVLRLVGCDGGVIDEIYWGAPTDNPDESLAPWSKRLPAPIPWYGTTNDGPRTFERRDLEDTNSVSDWVSQSCPTPSGLRSEALAPIAIDAAYPAAADEVFEGLFQATDADSASLTFTASASGGTVTITDPRTGAFTWSPPANAAGLYELVFKASDGCHGAFGWVTLCIGGNEIPGNAIDENCDGILLCFDDRDGDGYGTATTKPDLDGNGCQSAGESTRSDDCDDNPTGCGASCHPDLAEVCDGRNNDCNASTADGSGDPSLGAACDSTADSDLCTDDVRACSGGTLVCNNNAAQDAAQVEVCDPFDLDEDCDGQADDLDTTAPVNRTRFFPDNDGDGFGTGTGILRCNTPANHATTGGDCADGPGGCGSACFPTRTESVATGNCADGFDNNCDSQTDTDETCAADIRCYRDRDRDGVGDSANQILLAGASASAGCSAWLDGTNPAGSWVTNGTDCADDPAGCGASCHPGLAELCDGQNNDCDASTADGSTDPQIGAPCDSPADADSCLDETSVCSAGTRTCPNNATGDAARVEICDLNNLDEDCDGGADDLDPQANATGRTSFFIDQDGDGRGRANGSVLRCDLAAGFSTLGGDCDDVPSACGAKCRPGLVESGGSANCSDTFDNDCDGFTDTDTECFGDVLCYLDRDRDGYGRFATETVVSTPGGCASYNDGVNALGSWVGNGLDCDDDPNACGANCHPGRADICDGFDNDCVSTTIDGANDPSASTACDAVEDQDLCLDDRMVCRNGAMACSNITTNDLAQDLRRESER